MNNVRFGSKAAPQQFSSPQAAYGQKQTLKYLLRCSPIIEDVESALHSPIEERLDCDLI